MASNTETIELPSGKWTAHVFDSGRCEIYNQNGDRIHATNDHISTLCHLAMALEENQRLQEIAQLLSNTEAESHG